MPHRRRPPRVPHRFFETYSELDYARGGARVDETVVMSPADFTELTLTYTMLEPLKKLGVPVELQHGVLALTEPYTVCSAGDELTHEQARLLVRAGRCGDSSHAVGLMYARVCGPQKLFWKPLAQFRIQVLCSWNDGKFEKY